MIINFFIFITLLNIKSFIKYKKFNKKFNINIIKTPPFALFFHGFNGLTVSCNFAHRTLEARA